MMRRDAAPPPQPGGTPPEIDTTSSGDLGVSSTTPEPRREFEMPSVLLGPDGLRAGWSILLFLFLLYILATAFGMLVQSIVGEGLHLRVAEGTAPASILGESAWTAALLVSAAVMAKLEGRRLRDYYLGGSGRAARFLVGAVSGFAALSVLVATLALGGWIRFGSSAAVQGSAIRHACTWAAAFLLVAFTEEGTFRCYLQSTLSRGLQFWTAVAVEAAFCVWKFLHGGGHGDWGVYLLALLGSVPALFAELRKSRSRSFWLAAWVSSTGFGFIHTGNNGENWIGIFAAGAIGFVFCASVWLTGSAWWAIGCHAAWDWAETFFYGTPDSGFVPRGHLLSTTPAGPALWSGGTDGPEGSVLILPVIVLLLGLLFAAYGRRRGDMETHSREALPGGSGD